MEAPSRMDCDDRGDDQAEESQRGFLGMFSSRNGKPRGDAAVSLRTHEALLLLRNYEESG